MKIPKILMAFKEKYCLVHPALTSLTLCLPLLSPFLSHFSLPPPHRKSSVDFFYHEITFIL